MKYALTRLGK